MRTVRSEKLMSLDLLVLMRVCLRWNQVEKAQHEPHWPWFLIGVTVPCGPVNRLGGRRNVELLDVENLVDVVLQRRGASQPQKRLVSTSTKPQHRVFLGCLEALVAGHHRGLDLECRPRSPATERRTRPPGWALGWPVPNRNSSGDSWQSDCGALDRT